MVGLDQSEHRAPEQHQQTGEAAEVGGLRREVTRRVEEHGHADPTDDQRHRGGEPVEAQVNRQAEVSDPAQVLRDRPVGRHLIEVHDDPDRRRRQGDRPDEEGASTESGTERHQGDADDGEHGEGNDHVGDPSGEAKMVRPSSARYWYQ